MQQAEQTFRLADDRPTRRISKMVLLGHSMGGLLSHAMAVDSEQKFWELNTYVPFPQIKGPPEVLEELQRYMFFDAQPFVSRVVFLAVPHRGSELSRGVVGRVSSNLISEPTTTSAACSTGWSARTPTPSPSGSARCRPASRPSTPTRPTSRPC